MGAYYDSGLYTDDELQRRALDRYQTAEQILDAALDVARTAPVGTDPLSAILQAMIKAAEANADLRVVMTSTEGES